MSSVTRLLLIRHGKTENPENRCYGWRDIPLATAGIIQMNALAERLADLSIDRVIASDFTRTVESARPFAHARGLDVVTVPELREIHFGDIEGLVFHEVEERFPDTAREWVTHPEQVTFPNGENFDRVCGRVVPWTERHVERHPGSTSLLVVHSGTIRALLRRMTNCPPAATLMVKIAYGDVFVCDWDAMRTEWTTIEQWNPETGERMALREVLGGGQGETSGQ